MIYFDHAAATPLDKRVLAAMQPYFSEQFFNPSAPYAAAVEVKRAYQDAKHRLAVCIVELPRPGLGPRQPELRVEDEPPQPLRTLAAYSQACV